MTATDELMALLAKATAGEWFQPDGEGGHIWNNDAEPGEGYVPDRHIVAGPNKPSWVKDRTSDEWLTENAHNLAAIVAAVNFCRTELPALIAERDALREALDRQGDNMAFLLNNVGVPQPWYDKFTAELAEDRAALGASHDAK